MRIEHIDFYDQTKMDIAKEIRYKVFVIEQNVPFEEDWDEEYSENYLIFNEKEIPIGTMRWRDLGEKIKLERVAVLEEYRNKGYGEMLVREVIKNIKDITTKPITLHSQLKAIPLYQRIGFKEYGELFFEAEIPHYAMKLEE
ncbi:MAG: GNAT family N-acetyltransferase [Bacteroidales bacterium]|jgi:predicted GNAT family N-acyltransferase|nr:GNAT family N-acetyltransferase [Bacteroidales bacterium]MDD4703096.1 GNAT family N-acetyltransferase [Bacteroidales bacterium]MDX9798236.1 GNAT family N-acetyltransferase [Bacteroidales bacterium]